MHPSPKTATSRSEALQRRWLLCIAVFVALLGAFVLGGWYTHSVTAVQIVPTFAPMQANTAVGFVASGLALACLLQGWRFAARVLAAGTVAIGSATLVEYLASADLGIDRLLVEPFTTVATSHPGRPSPITAICFVLVGASLLLVAPWYQRSWPKLVGAFLGTTAAALGCVALTGYGTGLETFGLSHFTKMAVHTATLFVLLGVAIAIVGWTSASSGFDARRWFVPVAAAAFVLILSLGLWQAVIAREQREIARETQLATRLAGDRIRARMSERADALVRLAERRAAHFEMPRSEWMVDAAHCVDATRGLVSVGWVDPSFTVQWSYPEATNDGLEGSGLNLGAPRAEYDVARATGMPAISEVLELESGRSGVVLVVPVARPDGLGGYVSGQIQVDAILGEITVPSGGLADVALTISDDGRVFFETGTPASGTLAAANAMDVSVLNRTWQVSAVPSSAHVNSRSSPLPVVVLVTGILLASLLAYSAYVGGQARRQAVALELVNQELLNEASGRSLAVEALRESELRYRDLIENASDVIYTHSFDGDFTSVNAAALRVFGFTEAQFLKMNLRDIVDPKYHEALFEALASRFDGTDRSAALEVLTYASDGHPVWFEVTARTVFDGNEPVGVQGVGRDVTARRAVERERRESDARYRDLFENASDLIQSVSVDGHIRFVNPAWRRTLGYTDEEANGLSVFDVVHPDSRQHCIDALHRVLQGEALDKLEAVFVTKDGRPIWLEGSVNARFVDGQAVSSRGIFRDVTERKLAEAELRNLTAFQQAIFDSADYSLISTSVDGTIRSFNRTAERWLGYRANEVVGLVTPALIHDPDEVAARAKELSAELGTHIEPGFEVFVSKARTGAADENEWTYVRKDGSTFPVRLSVTALRDESGDIIGFLGIANDITERRRLEQWQARFVAILESTTDFVGLADPTGHALYVNLGGRRMIGLDADTDLSARALANFHSPEVLQRIVNDGIPAAIRDGSWTGESAILQADGSEMPVSQVIIAHRDRAGEVDFLGTIMRDISGRVREESELRAAKELAESATLAKSQFLANMSHEIRTPMNSVIGMTGLLLDTELGEDQFEFASAIRSSGETLLTLINDILDFSKIESGQLDFEEEAFDVQDCIEEALDLFGPAAAEKGIDLAYLIVDGVPRTFSGDVTRLRQILVNLVGNAVKFTTQGEVLVSLTSRHVQGDRHELEFSVRDTGIGIPEDGMDRLFRSFSQVDASTTRNYGGSGLGLAISRRLAELMGGRMWVSSQVGKGSTFFFTIESRALASQLRVYQRGVQPTLAGKRVLIVDDNATNRRVLSLQAKGWGMLPRGAESAREALEWLRDGQPFDIAILDMNMPDMDGLQLASEIRRTAGRADLRLILLSSMGRPPAGDAAVGEISAVLTKPVKAAQLYDVLMRADGTGKPDKSRVTSTPSLDRGLGARHPLRILVAEDNVVNQKVAIRLLDRMGYRADVAANGVEALEALRRQPYDVVLMDVHMPGMDGLEASKRISAEWKRDDRPRIIAMTANAMRGDRERCLEAGMDDYVSKPVRIDELQRALEQSPGRSRVAPTNHTATAGSVDVQSRYPDELSDLRQYFLESSIARLDSMVESVASLERRPGDAAALTQLDQDFHNMAGTGGSFGYQRVTELGRIGEGRCKTILRHEHLPRAVDIKAWRELIDRIREQLSNSLVPENTEAPLTGSGPVDVLIIDSDEEFSGFLSDKFAAEGLRSRVVASGIGSYRLIGGSPPRAVVIEVCLPDTSGYDLVELIRRHPGWEACPIVMVSGVTDFLGKVEAIRCGADAYFDKPLDWEVLWRRFMELRQGPTAEPARILVVEDDPDEALSIRTELEFAENEVRVCEMPERLEVEISTFRPEILIVEVLLRGVSGFDLVRYLRKSGALSTVPVVFVTSEGKVDVQVESIGAGGDDCLVRPIPRELLLSTVSGRVKKARETSSRVDRDGQTGLLTSAAFLERARATAEDKHRDPGRDSLLVMIHLDDFKLVNERHGHLAGDRVLVSLAAMLKRRLRRSDAAGRCGVGGFGLLLEDLTETAALHLVRRLLGDFAEKKHVNAAGATFNVTVSAGVAVFDPVTMDLEAWKEAAEAALYRAKAAGGSRVEVARPRKPVGGTPP